MQSFVVFVFALVAATSAHHLGLISHSSAPWITAAPEAAAMRYIDAEAMSAAEEAAVERAMMAGSSSSPIFASHTSPWDPAVGASEEAAIVRAMIAETAASPYASGAAAINPLARALASARHSSPVFTPAYFDTPMTKVCSEGICRMIPTSALFAASVARHLAPGLMWSDEVHFASPSGAFIDPTTAAKFGVAGPVMVPIDDISRAADIIDPTTAAKFAGAGGFMVPMDSTFRKYARDAAGADLSGAPEHWGPIDAGSAYPTHAFGAMAGTKYAAVPKFVRDAALRSAVPAGRLVKVCEGGVCKIIDAASPAAHAALGEAAAIRDLEAAKYAAAVRGLSAAKYADDAAKYADAVGAKLIIAN